MVATGLLPRSRIDGEAAMSELQKSVVPAMRRLAAKRKERYRMWMGAYEGAEDEDEDEGRSLEGGKKDTASGSCSPSLYAFGRPPDGPPRCRCPFGIVISSILAALDRYSVKGSTRSGRMEEQQHLASSCELKLPSSCSRLHSRYFSINSTHHLSQKLPMFGKPRGGTRGGQAEFSWEAVRQDKDRESQSCFEKIEG